MDGPEPRAALSMKWQSIPLARASGMNERATAEPVLTTASNPRFRSRRAATAELRRTFTGSREPV